MFDLNNYYRLRNANGDTLSLGAFNGASSFVVWKKDAKGRPAIKIKVSPVFAADIAKKLTELAGPNASEGRIPYVIQKYNPDTKRFEVESSICIVRDDKNIFSIELSASGSGAKFEIRANQLYSDGSAPISKEARSLNGVKELIIALTKQLPEADLLSTYGMKSGGKSDPFAGKSSSTSRDNSASDDIVAF